MAKAPLPNTGLMGKTIGGLGRGLASTAGSMLHGFVSGFFNVDLSSGKKSKLGMFGKALGAGVSGSAVSSAPLPTMEQPTRVSNKSNPSLATITSQLEDLIKTANKIGVYTKEQQAALLNQINQTKRSAKEQQLENKTSSVPELPQITDSNSLGPLDQSVDVLITKIDALSDTVTGLSSGGLGFGGTSLSPLDLLGGKDNKPIPSKGAAKASTPSWLSKATAAISSGASSLRKAAPVAIGAASSKVAGLMSAGFGATKRAGGSIKAAARRAAGPIISKALGRTVLKSIPLVGTGIGVGLAVNSLMRGDVVGAGIELASGVAGPLTAVPALAASVTRDTYASVYGIQPEQDPNFKQRYGELKGSVDEMIKEQLTGAVKPKPIPTDREIGETETPSKPPPAAPTRQPPAIPPVTSPAGAMGGSPASTAAPETIGAGSTGTAATPSTSSGSAAQSMTPSPTSGSALSTTAMEQKTSMMSGATLTAQQLPVADINQSFGFDPNVGMFTQQTGNTTRGAAQGIGNIPSPVYSADGLQGLMRTLFFGS